MNHASQPRTNKGGVCRATVAQWLLPMQRAALPQHGDPNQLPFSMEAVAEELNVAYAFHELPADGLPQAFKWLHEQSALAASGQGVEVCGAWPGLSL